MDLFRKIFGEKGDNPDGNNKDIKKSPHNMSPLDLQKHIEAQMRDILKSFDINDDGNIKAFDENILDDFTQPEFENHVKQFFESNQNSMVDIDLDGKIPAAQIDTFLHRLPPNMNSQTKFRPTVNKKRTDNEKIMDRIHGTAFVEPPTPKRNQRTASPPQHFSRASVLPPSSPSTEESHNSINNGNVRSFGQSIISQTVRKPDGSYETKRIVRDSDGKSTTTITKMQNGKTETITYEGVKKNPQSQKALDKRCPENLYSLLKLDQNLIQTKDGYTIPRNLWKY